jgi:hypothetical protein
MFRITQNLIATLTVLASIFANAPSYGATITYDFSGQIDTNSLGGPLSGQLFSGSFSYDSSISPIGGGVVAGGYFGAQGLLTAVNFSFNGISYDFSTVNAGSIQFNPDGSLLAINFGDHLVPPVGFDPGEAEVVGGSPHDFFIDAGPQLLPFGGGFGELVYSLSNTGFNYGIVTSFEAVPEPSTLALFGAALIALGLMWRRKMLEGDGSVHT